VLSHDLQQFTYVRPIDAEWVCVRIRVEHQQIVSLWAMAGGQRSTILFQPVLHLNDDTRKTTATLSVASVAPPGSIPKTWRAGAQRRSTILRSSVLHGSSDSSHASTRRGRGAITPPLLIIRDDVNSQDQSNCHCARPCPVPARAGSPRTRSPTQPPRFQRGTHSRQGAPPRESRPPLSLEERRCRGGRASDRVALR